MEKAARKSAFKLSPCDREVIAAAVWSTEGRKGAVGSAQGGLQVEGEAQHVVATRPVSAVKGITRISRSVH
jgi:hypothetical protein